MIPCLPVKIKEVFRMEKIIQEIKRYVEETEMDGEYQISLNDILALCDVADRDTCGAICYTFLFGKAMGYRATKGIQLSTP